MTEASKKTSKERRYRPLSGNSKRFRSEVNLADFCDGQVGEKLETGGWGAHFFFFGGGWGRVGLLVVSCLFPLKWFSEVFL